MTTHSRGPRSGLPRPRTPTGPRKPSHLIVNMESEIVVPGPFQKPIEPGSYGPLYEMRYYDATPGSMPEIMEAFGAKLPDRRKHSDLFFAGSTDMGLLNKLIHIWPYNDMNHRTETRAAAVAAGDWPPPIGAHIVVMNTKFMLPASFSPVQ